jgi:hypothetical protein
MARFLFGMGEGKKVKGKRWQERMALSPGATGLPVVCLSVPGTGASHETPPRQRWAEGLAWAMHERRFARRMLRHGSPARNGPEATGKPVAPDGYPGYTEAR